MYKIIKNDMVIVISGGDKGRTGKVLQVLGEDKIVVEGVNVVKKHQKPNPARNIEGGILTKNMPIHISNVAILHPVSQKPDRIGIKIVEQDGKFRRVRVCKSDGIQLK